MVAMELQAELGECSLDERALEENSGQLHVARRLHEYLLERRGQVIGSGARAPVAAVAFRPGISKFMPGAEVQHRLANLLCLRHPDPAGPKMRHQALHAIIF